MWSPDLGDVCVISRKIDVTMTKSNKTDAVVVRFYLLFLTLVSISMDESSAIVRNLVERFEFVQDACVFRKNAVMAARTTEKLNEEVDSFLAALVRATLFLLLLISDDSA